MKMQQLAAKLSAEHMASFMQAPAWHPASQRGLTWAEAAVRDGAIKEAAALLTPYAAEVFKELLRLFAAMPVEGERLIKELRRHTGLSGAECQHGIAELEEAGILFSVRKVWGENLYFTPVECFAGWQRALFPCTAEPISVHERERLMNGVMRPYCRPLGRQLLSAFSALGRCGLGLTVSGTLPKKTVAKLMQAVDIDERYLKTFDLKWSYPDVYPLTVAFILEAASAFGLLDAAEGSLKWNEAMLSGWLKLEEAARERQLMNWCLGLLLPSGAGSAHLAAALIGLQAGEWYSVRDMEKWLREATGMDMLPNEGITELGWFGLWHSMGWLELVDCHQSDDKEMFFRWKSSAPLLNDSQTGIPESSPFIAVQPNGEVMVQPECPFKIRWELELLAERKSDEQIAVYRLEAASISRALELGRTRAVIQAFLQQSSGGAALPPTVEALLEVWTSRACRTEFAEVVLLRCDNEAMAAIVQNDAALAPMLLQKLGSLDFIVNKSQISEIKSMLQKAGYPARKAIQSGARNEQPGYPIIHSGSEDERVLEICATGKTKTTAPSYIYEAFPLHHFELNKHAARKKLQAFSQLEQVPAMWTKQLRAYHHSTRKELIEQALQWQTPVQLRMDRELRSFIPEKLEQKDGGWAVVGLLRDEPQRELIRLTPDMWEEMRLVIPGQGAPI